MTEADVLTLIAETLRDADDPDMAAVATFGGGPDGPPGVRVDHPDGTKSFLVASAQLHDPTRWTADKSLVGGRP